MRTEPLSAKGAGVAKALATKNPVSERMRSIRRVLWVILVLNLAVAAAKYVYGLMSGSASMQADGIHSVFDSAGNVVGLVGIALAARPADDSHPYGHAKFETYASLVIGVLLGVTSAVKRGSLFDGISMVIATIGVCVPLFVISVLLLYLFAGVLKWLPTYGLTTWKHYILPVTCLSFSPIAYIARMTRSSMLEVMQQDYIRTARAKGVAERMVILKHGLRNAILPVVTYLGTLIANLLTGSFIVERLFAIPGLGKYFVDSITARDYNIIMGVTIFLGVFVVACNLIVDVVYGVIDPRVKLDE